MIPHCKKYAIALNRLNFFINILIHFSFLIVSHYSNILLKSEWTQLKETKHLWMMTIVIHVFYRMNRYIDSSFSF